ncbi:hypothetical protein [Pseudomonas nicosulfuronedens]
MNPAFIALGAANPGLLPLAFGSGSGYSGHRSPDEARKQFPAPNEHFCRPSLDSSEEWEEKFGTFLGIAGIVFLIILTSNMAPI